LALSWPIAPVVAAAANRDALHSFQRPPQCSVPGTARKVVQTGPVLQRKREPGPPARVVRVTRVLGMVALGAAGRTFSVGTHAATHENELMLPESGRKMVPGGDPPASVRGTRVNAVADLTVSQKILLAAHRLEEQGHTPFSAEALIVASWQDSPRTFGLKGFAEQYPGSNRVLACIMGERGLARRGWLVKMGQKLYTLSRQGKEEARRLKAGDDSPTPAPKRRALAQIKVPKDLEAHLTSLFSTTAFRRYEEGMKREITYRDACKFWGLPETVSGDGVDKYLEKVPATLVAVEQLLIGGSIELTNGQSVSQDDLRSLNAVHRFLLEQFARHLNQQREQRHRRF